MATTMTKLVTYEEWLEMPVTEDAIEEVVNGEIRLMPANNIKHTDTVQTLYDLLRPRLNKEDVVIYIANFGLIIRTDPLTSRVPDLAMFVRANMLVRDGYVHSPPELLVEVLSPSNTRAERAEKLADYESIGVPEVWMLSREARTIEVLHLIECRLKTVAIRNSGLISPKLFPEAVITIEEIWS